MPLPNRQTRPDQRHSRRYVGEVVCIRDYEGVAGRPVEIRSRRSSVRGWYRVASVLPSLRVSGSAAQVYKTHQFSAFRQATDRLAAPRLPSQQHRSTCLSGPWWAPAAAPIRYRFVGTKRSRRKMLVRRSPHSRTVLSGAYALSADDLCGILVRSSGAQC